MAKFASRRTLPSSWSSTLSIEEGGLLSLHALGDFAKRVSEGDDRLHFAVGTGTLGWSLNRWVLWEIISTFRSPLVPLSYFTLSTSRLSQVQGTFRMEERYFDAPVTIGLRPLWQDWESNGRTLWNRYYLDYFVHFQRPIQLNFRSPSRTLLNHTFVSCVHHGLNTLHLVQYFNSFRE